MWSQHLEIEEEELGVQYHDNQPQKTKTMLKQNTNPNMVGLFL